MTVSLKHKFTSAKSDGTDSTIVQPSNWNDEHAITLAAGKVLGRDTSASGAVQELPLAFDPGGQAMVPPAGTTAQRPASPVAGMIRYNTTFSKFEQYNGTSWGAIGGGAYIGDTAPSTPQAGDLWWKSDEGQMYVYYNDGTDLFWVVANAFSGGNAYLPVAGGTVNGNTTIAALLTANSVAVVGNSTIGGNETVTGKLTALGNSASLGALVNNISETATVNAYGISGNLNFDVTTQSVLFYTAAAATNWTLNVRGNATNSLNTLLGIGQAINIVFLSTNGTTAYYNNAFQIDGSAVTVKWLNGTAPGAGNPSAVDIYSYTIIKTAAATFSVFGSVMKFA
jgi:hypothetical protein